MTVSQKHLICRLGFLFLITLAVYGNTLNNGFVWDDTSIIVNNPLIEKLGNIPQMFLAEDTIDEPSGFYRPVTYISFALDRVVWGLNSTGFHFTNLILHCLVVLLFYRVIAALFHKDNLAFAAALVFALHPLTAETVNFLSGGRNTLLSACFAMLSLLLYVKNKWVPAVISFTVAIFSKEFALLLPMVFILYDCRIQREQLRSSRYVPYMISIAIYLFFRSLAVQQANFLAAINISDIVKAPYLVVRYALNMVAPVQLKILYDVQASKNIVIVCSVIVVAMMGTMYIFRKNNEILFSAFWFFLFLAPIINIIPLQTTIVMTDRYAYFSLMGFAVLLASVISKWNGRTVSVVIVTLCALYSIADFRLNRYWKNEFEFFTRMIEDAPESFVGFKNVAMSYYKNGDIAHAAQYLETADTKPDITVKYLIGDAYIFWKENMPEKAEKALLRALELGPLNPEPALLLMMINEQYGNRVLARSYRDKVKKMGHEIDETLTARTVELCRAGEADLLRRQYVDAEVYFWMTLKINPDYIPALIDMGSLRAEQGDFTNAMQYFNKALTIDPLNATVHFNLSELYKMQGKFADAQNEMTKYRDAEAMAQQKKGK